MKNNQRKKKKTYQEKMMEGEIVKRNQLSRIT